MEKKEKDVGGPKIMGLIVMQLSSDTLDMMYVSH